ncbi:MAG: hypothetical protein AAB779_00585, partial [Patescibacteria group bacterium]
MKNLLRNFIVFLVVFVLLAGLLSQVSSPCKKADEIAFNSLVAAVKEGKVAKIDVVENTLHVTFADQSEKQSRKENGESVANLLKIYGADEKSISAVEIKSQEPSGFAVWVGALAPFIVPLLLFVAFLWLMMRQLSGANNRA